MLIKRSFAGAIGAQQTQNARPDCQIEAAQRDESATILL
jgi:hypothetical protein